MSNSETAAHSVRLTIDEAIAFGKRGLVQIGYGAEEAGIVAENLVDAELCGYPALGLARVLTIAEHPRTRQPRRPLTVVHETPVSALIDGGNHVGLYSVHRAAEIAIEKARTHRFALTGVHNSYLSGRNARYAEMIARAGFVAFHVACSPPVVAPLGGVAPALGTNPLAFGLPADPDPVVFDMATSAVNYGDVILALRLDRLLPEGVALDGDGRPTRDPRTALGGSLLTFGGHKGYGLSFMVQALGLFAGAALPSGHAQDFGFLFVVFDPALLVPAEQFKNELKALIERVKSTPRQPGVDEIRIPSERAFRERERRRVEGITLEQRLYERIAAL